MCIFNFIYKVCKKAGNVARHFRKSNVANTALAEKQSQLNLKIQRLEQSCETRWDSKLSMFESLIRNRSAISSVLANRSITKLVQAQSLEISESEWIQIESLVKLLKPFKVATTVLCSETKVTMSMVRPIINGLLKKHMTPSWNDDSIATNFKIAATNSLKTRFDMGPNMENEEVLPTQIASFLDPR